MTTYAEFLERKRIVAPPVGITMPFPPSDLLFPFQRAVVDYALRRGRSACWLDTGLGKSWIALEWSRIVHQHTGGKVLILTPLAVAQQFKREAAKLELGVDVVVVREQADCTAPICVANYERLHLLDPTAFVGVVLDESSILKDYTASTRNQLIEAFSATPFKLCCSATPAPNDHTELGNHAEFLGVMTRTEMLSMFFVHDGETTQEWRLKGHAQRDFWRWIASWAVAIKRPSDIGYSDDGYNLPPLRIHEHVVDVDDAMARKAGMLFAYEANTLSEQREARRASLAERVKLAAEIVNGEPGESWVVWCDLNDESAALASTINGAVEVKGADSTEHKETAIAGFASGQHRVIVSKPSICGLGLNWQHCSRMAFVGLSHSFEAWYQAIRRIYRFGQTSQVEIHVITSSAEGRVVDNLKRKQADAERMAGGMVEHMREMLQAELGATARRVDVYAANEDMEVPPWLKSQSR